MRRSITGVLTGLLLVALALGCDSGNGNGNQDGGNGRDGGAPPDAALDVVADMGVGDLGPGSDAEVPGDAALDAASDAEVTDLGSGSDAEALGDAMGDAVGGDALVTDGGGLPPLGAGVVTLAGDGPPGAVDGIRGAARFNNPANLLVDSTGMIYVADFDNNLIRRVTPEGVVSTLTDPGDLIWPFGLALADATTLYVQTTLDSNGDQEVGALWRVSLTSGEAQLVLDDFGQRRGLVVLADGRLVTSNVGDHTLHIYTPSNGNDVLLAGASAQPAFVDGQGGVARFNTPYDMVLSPSGTIIVADRGNNRLREVALDGTVTTFAGDGVAATTDGARLAGAQLNQPQALAIDGAGNIYVSEVGGHVIRKIDTAGNVTTLAGTGQAGFKDDPDPSLAQFFSLEGIDVSPDGKYLYVADGDNGDDDPAKPFNRVRRIGL